MAGVRADLARIAFLCGKVVRIIDAAQVNTVLVLPDGDAEQETQITLTPAQKQAILSRADPFIEEIKTTAAGLP